jgi:hypothetical protein
VLLDGVARKDSVVLVDTNVVMEAVRTRCWNAIAGGLRIETVEECRDELQRGDRGRPGYLPVGEQDLARIRTVHGVSALDRATFAMAYVDARGMDAGERDLFAHAYARAARGDLVWIVSSADQACVRAAVALGWHERMPSSPRSRPPSACIPIRRSSSSTVNPGSPRSGQSICSERR